MDNNSIPNNFDWRYYFKANPDVFRLYGYLGEKGAKDHWIHHGYKENRKYNPQTFQENNVSISQKFPSKTVIYTAVSNNYDKLEEVSKIEDGIHYICFSDTNIQSSTWEIRPFPEFLKELDSTRKSRCIKILPHIFLPEYDQSVWVDGNIKVLGNVKKLIDSYLKESDFCTSKHPDRICIYKESEMIIKLKKDDTNIVNLQVLKYKNESYPENYGLVQTGIIFRNHNNEICKEVMNQWWKEVLSYSKRDQMSFNYVCWKIPNFTPKLIPASIISSEYFQYKKHGGDPITLPKGYGTMDNYINGNKI